MIQPLWLLVTVTAIVQEVRSRLELVETTNVDVFIQAV